MTDLLLEWTIKIAVILGAVLTAVAYAVLLERRVMAFIQLRRGPNRVGPFGLLQPAADGLKLIFKEDIIPSQASRLLYVIAPTLLMIPSIMIFIVIPFGSEITLFGRTIQLHVTHFDVGLLYVLALGSVSVYGIALAGWASNNKYSLLGGLRASAQMISYELALGLSVVGILIQSGSLDLVEIVRSQGGWGGLRWNVFVSQPLGFLVFFIAALAETNRLPFDLPEADSELVAGYHTEYSSMKFVMFQMGEYCNLIASAAISTTLFWGGWMGPGVETYPALSLVYFTAKVFVFVFVFIWIRFTLPRFRYDQLMRFGWRVLLPLAILNIIITATVKLFVS
ncbi:MAG: NADH-quinone oxidoreductase subunit NuoH [Acidobacteriota bacterium]